MDSKNDVQSENDPLDIVFATPEQSLAWFLQTMPASLVPVFERNFKRVPAPLPFDTPPIAELTADEIDGLGDVTLNEYTDNEESEGIE